MSSFKPFPHAVTIAQTRLEEFLSSLSVTAENLRRGVSLENHPETAPPGYSHEPDEPTCIEYWQFAWSSCERLSHHLRVPSESPESADQVVTNILADLRHLRGAAEHPAQLVFHPDKWSDAIERINRAVAESLSVSSKGSDYVESMTPRIVELARFAATCLRIIDQNAELDNDDEDHDEQDYDALDHDALTVGESVAPTLSAIIDYERGLPYSTGWTLEDLMRQTETDLGWLRRFNKPAPPRPSFLDYDWEAVLGACEGLIVLVLRLGARPAPFSCNG